MSTSPNQSDIVIAGAGIAGLIASYQLLKSGFTVQLFDKDLEENLGGLALEAAGGIHLIDTPIQRRAKIQDSPELAWSDWQRLAEFSDNDTIQAEWAKFYCYHSKEFIYDFLEKLGIRFLFQPLWAERDLFLSGNSVPRWHVVNGTGYELVNTIIAAIHALPEKQNFALHCQHEVNDISVNENSIIFSGTDLKTDTPFIATAKKGIVASGGIGGGDLTTLKKYWPGNGKKAPEYMLNGAHRFGDGKLHDVVENLGGALTNLENNWLYAAGVHHPDPRKPYDGISLQPGPGILWFNAKGERIGPMPLISFLNTKWLVDQILEQPGQYTWLILNNKIAKKELIVSLSRYFTAIREKKLLLLLKNLIVGDQPRIDRLIQEAPDDVLVAHTLPELIEKMKSKQLYDLKLDEEKLTRDIKTYDDMIDRGHAYFNDEQLRRIENFRGYFADKLRLCKFQKILDPSAGPLMAIRSFLISRKSLGSIKTDLQCRVLKQDNTVIPHLYAIGEAAGFGGGGIHGKGAPEGAFLGGCILTAVLCAREIQCTTPK